MVDWYKVKFEDIEFDDHATIHGIKKEDYEELFSYQYPIYVKKNAKFEKKAKYYGEDRYGIIGKAFGKYIFAVIAVKKMGTIFKKRERLKLFSGRMACKKQIRLYKEKYHR